jgi:hypothetical protein
MSMIALYTALYLYIVAANIYPMHSEKKSFWTNMAILSLAYLLTILIAIHIQIPSPAKPIETLVKGITGGQ